MGQAKGTTFPGTAAGAPVLPTRSAMFDGHASGALPLGNLTTVWLLFFQAVSAAIGLQLGKYSQALTPAAMSFVVQHDLATLDVVAQIYTTAGVLTTPLTLTTTDSATVTVTFSAPFTGFAVVIG